MPNQKTLREEVLSLLRQRGLNATDVACYVDLAQSYVWNFLAGTKPETQRVREEMQHFMTLVRRGQILTPTGGGDEVVAISSGARRRSRVNPKRHRHYETETVKRVASTIEFCIENASIGLISAGFGSGKTDAAKLWRVRHADIESLYFEFDHFTGSHSYDFLTALASRLGIDQEAHYHNGGRVFRAVVNRLREQPAVLIFDQCEMLRVKVLQLVRQLWDRTREEGVAVVLLAAPQLVSRLERGRSGDLGALRSRIGVWVSLRGLSRDDMAQILKAEGITNIDDEAFNVWYETLGGSMRWFMEGIDLLKSRHADKRISERTIAGALRSLMGLSIAGNGSRFR